MFILRGTSLRREICIFFSQVADRARTFIKFDRKGVLGNNNQEEPKRPKPAAIRLKSRKRKV